MTSMATRNTPIPDDAQRMSTEDIASYMMFSGRNVGLPYKTHGDVWSAKHEIMVEGLLRLILRELYALNKNNVDEEKREEGLHRWWLERYQPQAAAFKIRERKAVDKIVRMMPFIPQDKLTFPYDIPEMCLAFIRTCDRCSSIPWWCHKHCWRCQDKREMSVHKFIDHVIVLESVKRKGDCIKLRQLRGIGKQTIKKWINAAGVTK